MGVTVKVETTDTESLLSRLDLEVRGPALAKALRASVAPIKKEAKRRVPHSTETGTREQWSAATKASRSGTKPLAQTIGTVIRHYAGYMIAVVGPQYPAGALGHLIESGHKLVAWGKPTGLTVDPKPFLEPAVDATRGQQQQRFEAKLRRDVEAWVQRNAPKTAK